MNDIQVAVKYGAESTINTLMEELEENGMKLCMNLLIEMDNMIKTGRYEKDLVRVAV